MTEILTFPENFTWGAATAATQIEGAAAQDGKERSIWDSFSDRPGTIADGTDPSIACDHYHRFSDDFALMREMGIPNYRFSIAWPRVVANGQTNERGLEFYDRLVDAMLEQGIRPFATLFHWDLPQSLQDNGGFANRSTVDAYLRYADTITRRLGDRVTDWMTFNEPWVFAFVGHLYGAHAPGLKNLKTALAVAHNILLAHGRATQVIRANGNNNTRVGIVHNLEWVVPASEDEKDVAAASRHDGAFNRWFLDPILRGSYPGDMLAWYGDSVPDVQAGDLETICAPTDFLGINYYTRRIIAHDDHGDFLNVRRVRYPFVPHAEYEEWEVNPEGLYRLIMRVHRDYGAPSIYITENGTPLGHMPGPDTLVHDPDRIDYLAGHFAAAWQAIQDGADVRGYFVWSFIDNFEWNFGVEKRFGLVYVDYSTQRRIVKDSGRWYGEVIRQNGVRANK